MTLHCITIDDEPLALNLINSFVERTPFLQLSASFFKASEAVTALTQPGIQLVFLDIHMPGFNGIELARLLRGSAADPPPRVIFSTAYNQFAAESYQVDALDYLLKPFTYDDFLHAAQKALDFFQKEDAYKQIDESIYVSVGYQQVKVMLKDIKYIQGLRDYATIHLKTTDKPILTLGTLKSLLSKLPPDRFVRVQRSFIVAIDSVTTLSSNSLWVDNTEIKIGEQYKNELRQLFEARR